MAKIKQFQIDEKYLWIGGGILTVVIVIFVLGRLSAKKKEDKDLNDINPNINSITVSTDAGSIDWNPSALVKKVYTAYEVNWYGGRCDVLKELLDLQDVQLRAVADGYAQVYGKTLRKTLNDAWGACYNMPWSTDPHYQVIHRLDVLQIA